MRGSIPEALVVTALLTSAACASVPRAQTELIRHFECADGSRVSAEIHGAVVRLYTVTGVIELPRQRRADPALYTNGLRSIVIEADGTLRHAVGRLAWTACSEGRYNARLPHGEVPKRS